MKITYCSANCQCYCQVALQQFTTATYICTCRNNAYQQYSCSVSPNISCTSCLTTLFYIESLTNLAVFLNIQILRKTVQHIHSTTCTKYFIHEKLISKSQYISSSHSCITMNNIQYCSSIVNLATQSLLRCEIISFHPYRSMTQVSCISFSYFTTLRDTFLSVFSYLITNILQKQSTSWHIHDKHRHNLKWVANLSLSKEVHCLKLLSDLALVAGMHVQNLASMRDAVYMPCFKFEGQNLNNLFKYKQFVCALVFIINHNRTTV